MSKIVLRPAVKRFAEKMEQVLRLHDGHKSGWDDSLNDMSFLEKKLDEEYLEWRNIEGEKSDKFLLELVDISNICMMLFSRYGKWSKKYLK